MRSNLLILSRIVLCAINFYVSGYLYRELDSAYKVQSRQMKKEVNDTTTFIEYNINDRQRRSLWTRIKGHIAAESNKLHPELVLAEGVNGVEGFNENFKSKLSDRSKSSYAMLSEGTGDGEAHGKKAYNEVSKSSKVAIDDGLIESRPNRYLTEDEMLEVKKQLERVSKLHEEVHEEDRKLQHYVVDLDTEHIFTNDYGKIYNNKINHKETEPILYKILAKHPEGKETVIKGIKLLRKKYTDLYKQNQAAQDLMNKYGGAMNPKQLNEDKTFLGLIHKFIGDTMSTFYWITHDTELEAIEKL